MTVPFSPYAMNLWRAAFDRCSLIRPATGLVGFEFFRRVPNIQIDPSQTPLLTVHLLKETWTPDGDPNAGPPRFIVSVSLGLQGTWSGDDESQYDDLGIAMGRCDDALFSDPSFVALVEGFQSVERVFRSTQIGETMLAECKEEIHMYSREVWQPKVPYFLEKVGITTVYPSAERAVSTQQIAAEVEIETE